LRNGIESVSLKLDDLNCLLDAALYLSNTIPITVSISI